MFPKPTKSNKKFVRSDPRPCSQQWRLLGSTEVCDLWKAGREREQVAGRRKRISPDPWFVRHHDDPDHQRSVERITKRLSTILHLRNCSLLLRNIFLSTHTKKEFNWPKTILLSTRSKKLHNRDLFVYYHWLRAQTLQKKTTLQKPVGSSRILTLIVRV